MDEKVYDLTDAGDTEKTYFVRRDGQDHIVKTGCDDDVLQQNYEDRKTDGFDPTRCFRRVAHIDMGTVRILADVQHDADARAYLEAHDTAARDRMIRRYPELFKACSGGV